MKLLINGYTVTESFEIRRNYDFISYLDKSIKHIKKNKKNYMKLVLLIVLTVNLSAINVYANNLNAIDKAGTEILTIIRRVGYWVGIILCSKDVIKHCMRGHLESIGTVIAMYGMGFGALYFLPWLFDLIKGIF